MQILPDESLYTVAQPFAFRGVPHQSLTVGLGFDLVSEKPQPAAKVVGTAMKALAPGDCLDVGLPKPYAEWLMAGFAQTPAGRPLTALAVEVRIGAASRRFLVRGETDAKGQTLPFTEAPLLWSETFGAPGHAENPLGCGLVPDPKTGRIRLPRLVDADAAHGRAVCPGPMGAWPARMRNMGTYDERWIQTRCPDLPDDCDLSYVNLAQPAQRLPNGIVGNEAIYLAGVNADHPEIHSHLPGKSVRVFVKRKEKPEEESFLLAYDTLWLFPNEAFGLLLAHLLVPCADSAASDIETARFEITPPDAEEAALAKVPKVKIPSTPDVPDAPEAPSPPLSAAAGMVGVASAASVISAPAAAATPATPAAAPAPAAPAPPPDGVAAMRESALKELDASLPEINAALESAGLPPLTPEQIAETKAQIVQQTAAIQNLTAQADAMPTPDLHAALRQAGLSEEAIGGVDKVMEITPPNPADYGDAASWNAAVERYLTEFESHLSLSDSARETQRTTLSLMGPGGDAALTEMAGPTPTLEDAIVRAGIAPDKAAWLAHELEQTPDFSSPDAMKAYMAQMEATMGFAPGSMTSVVESVQKVADQTGTPLEFPAARGAGTPAETAPTLDAPAAASPPEVAQAPDAPAKTPEISDPGAENVVSAASKMEDIAPKIAPPEEQAVTQGAKAVQDAAPKAAEASGTAETPPPPLDYAYQDLVGHDFSGQTLDGANFTHAKLAGANFTDASLKGANFDDADCEKANFTRAALDDASLQKTSFKEAHLTDAAAPRARFIESDLGAADASGMAAKDAEFSGVLLSGGIFAGANFSGALLQNVSAVGVKADGANFSDCNARQCDFSAATLSRAKFEHAVFSDTKFNESNLKSAQLAESTLLPGCTLIGADAAGARINGADWREVDARRSIFTACDARDGRFSACNFGKSRWQAAKLQGADFSRCELTEANFEKADLMRASLRETRAARTRFDSANLYGADFYRAGMVYAELKDAITDNTLLALRKDAP